MIQYKFHFLFPQFSKDIFCSKVVNQEFSGYGQMEDYTRIYEDISSVLLGILWILCYGQEFQHITQNLNSQKGEKKEYEKKILISSHTAAL